jgi:hypothetical protein
MSQLKIGRRNSFGQAFCSIQVFNSLPEAHSWKEGKFVLLSPPIQVLILSHPEVLFQTHPE